MEVFKMTWEKGSGLNFRCDYGAIIGKIYSAEYIWYEYKKIPNILAMIIYLALLVAWYRYSGFLMLNGIILAVRILEYLSTNCSAEEKDH